MTLLRNQWPAPALGPARAAVTKFFWQTFSMMMLTMKLDWWLILFFVTRDALCSTFVSIKKRTILRSLKDLFRSSSKMIHCSGVVPSSMLTYSLPLSWWHRKVFQSPIDTRSYLRYLWVPIETMSIMILMIAMLMSHVIAFAFPVIDHDRRPQQCNPMFYSDEVPSCRWTTLSPSRRMLRIVNRRWTWQCAMYHDW